MKKCKICGKELWDLSKDICDKNECFLENEFLKKKRLEEIKTFHEVLVKNSNKIFSLVPSRPWTASCVDNLFNNMEKNWPPEKTSVETKRRIEEIKYMQKIILKVGYSNLKRVLVKIERSKKKDRIDRELDWLKEIGVLNFFDYSSSK